MLNKLFVTFQRFLPQHGLSRVVGAIANCRVGLVKNLFIRFFIWKYKIDLTAAKETSLDHYENFNQFFTRELDLTKRAMDLSDNTIISPVDGTISQFGRIQGDQLIQAKGVNYSLEQLLFGIDVEKFREGDFATLYLSPKDYHRVHMPIAGKLIAMHYIPGKLFSVNEATTEHLPGLFAKNERLLCLFETAIGEVAVIFVGAMIVASIHTAWAGRVTPDAHGNIRHWSYVDSQYILNKGDEAGYFEMGSTIILLFEKNKIQWRDSITLGRPVKMGENLARI